MGKSLYIQNLAKELAEKKQRSADEDVHVVIPVHGPLVATDMLLDQFEKSLNKDVCVIYHIDIAPSVSMYMFIEARLCCGSNC